MVDLYIYSGWTDGPTEKLFYVHRCAMVHQEYALLQAILLLVIAVVTNANTGNKRPIDIPPCLCNADQWDVDMEPI